MAGRIKPIALIDFRDLPFTLQEWIREVSSLLYSSSGVIPVTSGGTGLASGTSGGVLGFTSATTIASSVALTQNAIVLGGGAGATPTPLSSLGTSTTVLHGNAAGAPSWGSVVLTTDVSGRLPLANLGGVGSTGTVLRSNGTDYAASTATYPDTVSANQLLYATSANVIGSSATLTYDGTKFMVGSSSNNANLQSAPTMTDPTSGYAMLSADGTYTSQTGAIANLSGALAQPIFVATGAGTISSAHTAFWLGRATLAKATAATVGISTFNGMRINLALTGAGNTGRITTACPLNIVAFNNAGSGVTAAQIGQIYGVQVANLGTATGSAGVTISSSAGMSIIDQSGATNNTNLMLGTNGFASGNYSIYNFSTYQNIHAGKSFFGGTTTPTAQVHLAAGTTAANSAPLKFTSGSLMTSAEAGAVEFLTDKFYGTITTGAARKELTLNDAALTSGRVPYVTTNGRLTDAATLTFNGTSLTNAVGAAASSGIFVTGSNSPRIHVTSTGSTVTARLAADDASGYGGTVTNHPFTITTNLVSGMVMDTSQRLAIGSSVAIDTLRQINIAGTYSGQSAMLIQSRMQPAAGDSGSLLLLSGTLDIAGSGTHTNFDSLALNQPTLTAGAGTVTNATTLRIAAAPTGATNNRALWVQAGKAKFDGNMEFGTHSAIGAETVTGYITITDSAGNSRKLAVVS